MPSQTDFMKVSEALLLPLAMIWGGYHESVVDTLVERLKHHDLVTFGAAVDHLKLHQKTKPTPAQIISACEALRSQKKMISENGNADEYPWNTRDRQAKTMMEDFMKGYINSPDMMEADRQGWGHDLYKYAREIAWIQAKLICDVSKMGMPPYLYDYGYKYDLDEYDKRHRELMIKCFEQSKSGRIEITHIPEEAIAFWKAELQRPQRQYGNLAKPMKMPITNREYFDAKKPIAGSSSGRTADFESANDGSTPSPASTTKEQVA